MKIACLALALGLLSKSVDAQIGSPQLPEVDWVQRLGNHVPLDARFVNASGASLELGDLVSERPVVLAFVYYECPMLCGLVLNGLASALDVLKFDVGVEYDVIALGIDPGETPDMALAAKEGIVARYGRDESARGFHFLTGDEADIRAVADAVGFEYTYVPETDEYAHAAGACILTPTGELSRVYYGTEFSPRDLEFGLIEAADGKIGSIVDKLILRCFHYDPAKGKYGFAIMNVIRFFGTLTVVVIGLSIFRAVRRPVARGASGTKGREVPAS